MLYVGVSKNRGTPKWMVKIMENPIKMDDLGVPLFLETPVCICFFLNKYCIMKILSYTYTRDQIQIHQQKWELYPG